MIKHIVMWTFKDHYDGMDRETILIKVKEILESLNGKIEGLIYLQVGINMNPGSEAYDVCLITEHPSWNDLKNYQEHPLHKKVGEFIGPLKKQRTVVDFEYENLLTT